MNADEADDDRLWERPGAGRRGVEPHRGGLPPEEREPPAAETPGDPPPWADGRNYGSGAWFEEGDYGGTVDGLGNVSSDADPGL